MKFFGVVLCCAVCALPIAATSQSLAKLLSQSGLTGDDLRQMSEAAQSLYVGVSPREGASAAWQNPDTGSYGTSSLETVYTSCVDILHSVHPGGIPTPREIRNRRCKTETGHWFNATP